MELDKKWKP